jgi:hypothetical protein
MRSGVIVEVSIADVDHRTAFFMRKRDTSRGLDSVNLPSTPSGPGAVTSTTAGALPGLQGHDEVDRAATEHDDDPHLLRLMTPKKTPAGSYDHDERPVDALPLGCGGPDSFGHNRTDCGVTASEGAL